MYKKSNNSTLKLLFLIVCVILVIIILSKIIFKNYIFPLKYFDIVKSEAAKNNIDPYLVMAVIKTESNFDQNAISNKDAKGLMQIMDSTANDLQNKLNISNDQANLFDEQINISLGCKYLSSLIKKYNGNYYLAVCAYNAGMGNVDKWLKNGLISEKLVQYKNVNIPFKQTKDYLYKVINSYNIYRKLYG